MASDANVVIILKNSVFENETIFQKFHEFSLLVFSFTDKNLQYLQKPEILVLGPDESLKGYRAPPRVELEREVLKKVPLNCTQNYIYHDLFRFF